MSWAFVCEPLAAVMEGKLSLIREEKSEQLPNI